MIRALLLLVAFPLVAAAQSRPSYIDDTAYRDAFADKLTKLAEDGKCLAPADVTAKTKSDRRTTIALAASETKLLTPEDVYKRAKPSVFAIGCVLAPEKAGGEWEQGWFATAWVAAADGVLVTCWHVFETPERAHFGVVDAAGTVYPITDILAVNKKADIAVVKIAATKLTPLPVAAESPEVGSWVGVLSHPGHQWFTFTQGHVTRYTKNFGGPEFAGERWMSITADYAGGSSGGPVLDKFGAVVGMACLTSNIDYEGDEAPPADEKKEKPKAKADESKVQMIVKLTVPMPAVRKVLGATTVKK